MVSLPDWVLCHINAPTISGSGPRLIELATQFGRTPVRVSDCGDCRGQAANALSRHPTDALTLSLSLRLKIAGTTSRSAIMKTIPVAGPSITQKEIDYVAEATLGDWYENAGRFNARFERAFADHVGVRHAISLPSGTSAIHLSLAALGIGRGDEVVVPDATWIASAAPVTYVGAVPVFADIDPFTWCLDSDSFATCITPRTRAVIPVDLYGGMPDMEAINRIAGDKGIAVIEDAAQAIGSQYRGRRAGAFGDAGIFSFHGSKTLTTGEGGMMVSDRDDLYERARVLSDHGRPPGDRIFMNSEVAFKYKMSSMQAALGLAQLERIEELTARKRQNLPLVPRRAHGLAGPGPQSRAERLGQ